MVDIVKSMCTANAESWGKFELDETKIGRLDHKIEKLQIIRNVPGVEWLRPDAMSGDGGITLEEYAPFGVIGGDPAGDPLDSDAERQRGQHGGGGQRGGVQPAPGRGAQRGAGGGGLQQGDRPLLEGARLRAVPVVEERPGEIGARGHQLPSNTGFCLAAKAW